MTACEAPIRTGGLPLRHRDRRHSQMSGGSVPAAAVAIALPAAALITAMPVVMTVPVAVTGWAERRRHCDGAAGTWPLGRTEITVPGSWPPLVTQTTCGRRPSWRSRWTTRPARWPARAAAFTATVRMAGAAGRPRGSRGSPRLLRWPGGKDTGRAASLPGRRREWRRRRPAARHAWAAAGPVASPDGPVPHRALGADQRYRQRVRTGAAGRPARFAGQHGGRVPGQGIPQPPGPLGNYQRWRDGPPDPRR